MCGAGLLAVLYVREDARGALAVLSLETTTADVFGVRCKTLRRGHHPVDVCREALGAGCAGAASGKGFPWWHLGGFVLVAVRPGGDLG